MLSYILSMTTAPEKRVLTDAQWADLAPLIEVCRPAHKTEHHNLRRTIEAIIWRHDNGAKWRQIPAELGPWWMAAQSFIRWSRLGVWDRLLERVQQGRGVQKGMAFLDGSSIRAHQKAAGAAKKGDCSAQRDRREALGRSRGGYGTKACAIADGAGRALGFVLAPGPAHELPLAPSLLNLLMFIPLWIVGDRGYASRVFRALIRHIGAHPAVPAKSNETGVDCPVWIYNNRNRVERLWARLKEWRAVATRYEKTAVCFKGVLCLAATMDWLKS
jgi:transposase